MKKYEYKTVEENWRDGIPLDELNALGKDGWEMCGTAVIDFRVVIYFKRELQSE